MHKIEWVYREILFRAIEQHQMFQSQNRLAKECMCTLSNVHFALQPLAEMNAIEKKAQGFRILNAKKILVYWASKRKLTKEVVYATRSEEPIHEIEKKMPANVKFALYSGYKFKFRAIPSEYGEVFVYGEKESVEKRFPKKEGIPNVFVLQSDPHLQKFKQMPIAQLYVDLWNHNKWYAQEFVNALDKKMFGEKNV